MENHRGIVKKLIVLSIIINAVGLFSPILSSTFGPYYGSIAKHIALSNNWTDLVLDGKDWLDKPHLPFWVTALSINIFGINGFSYILPGFIFNLIGAYYTYKLAGFWYNKNIAMLSMLFIVTSFHILLSSIDVRAEVYLLGSIIPACYYWLMYDKYNKIRYLLFGAIFSATALMTKGLFTLITITSGTLALWIKKREFKNFISFKWLIALFITIILITPEVYSLYVQFDLHPEKIIFDRNHVSGIKWFFFDSQFGRFFNNGPIMSTNPPKWHYIFFIHTMLWAFLPWWPIFFSDIYKRIKNYKNGFSNGTIYLYSSFFVTFIIFSITKFQVDHYINILFPFAGVIAANYFYNNKNLGKTIYFLIYSLSFIIIVAIAYINCVIFNNYWIIIIIGVIFYLIMKLKNLKERLLTFAVLSVLLLYLNVIFINIFSFSNYDAGYKFSKFKINNHLPLYALKINKDNWFTLDYYTKKNFFTINDFNDIQHKEFYIVVYDREVKNFIKKYPKAQFIEEFNDLDFNNYVQFLLNRNKKEFMFKYELFYVDR